MVEVGHNLNQDTVVLALVDSQTVSESFQNFTFGITPLFLEAQTLDSVLPWVVQQRLDRKLMSVERENLENRLRDASYKNEMADVASTVLHNVGNVLNSVNVAAGMVESCVNDSSVTLVNRIAGLLAEQEGQLQHFLTEDPKGKRIPSAIQKLAPHLLEEQRTILKEIRLLMRNIDHVKHIISSHQTMAKSQGLVESVSLVDLLDEALELSFQPGDSKWVTLHRQFEEIPLAHRR